MVRVLELDSGGCAGCWIDGGDAAVGPVGGGSFGRIAGSWVCWRGCFGVSGTGGVGGAAWAIAYDKPKFNGEKALRAEKEAGIARRLRGLKLKDRGIPRGHMDILANGKVVGQTTSGTFSPTLKVGIALGLIDTKYKVGDKVAIDVRGRELQAEIVKIPMVSPKVKLS